MKPDKASMANRSVHFGFCHAFSAWRLIAAVVVWAILLAPQLVSAADGDWIEFENSKVRMISAVDEVGKSPNVRLGLHFKMDPGWKIYWRTAGEAGYPPSLDWKGSSGVEKLALQWPAPTRFEILGIESAGYKNEVVLPILLTRSDTGRPVQLRATLDYLICEKICVPRFVDLVLDIPAGQTRPSQHAHLIDSFRGQIPVKADPAQTPIVSAKIFPAAKGVSLQILLKGLPSRQKLDLFVEGKDFPWFWKPEIIWNGADGEVTVTTHAPDGDMAMLSDKPFALTLVSGKETYETSISPIVVVAPIVSSGQSLLAILAFAFLGGLILNLMPCVLPVLSIKLLSVLKHSEKSSGVVRLNFLASAAGVIAAFMLLAAGLSLLKAAGASLGWGIQFQQPVFLVFMILVITGFAANMLGYFEVTLPSSWSVAMVKGGEGTSLGAHFMTGAFATLLATPCSAPFLGTAVSYALSRSYGEIFAVFVFLGLGLALPYLLIAVFPGAVRYLPKPGKWMNTVKRLMALALVATALWLLTILWTQIGLLPVVIIAGLVCAMFFVLAQGERFEKIRYSAIAIFAVAALGFSAWTGFSSGLVAATSQNENRITWAVFSKAELARQIADGKTVFVDVTADWCLTCKFNKAAVLDRQSMVELFEQNGVVALRADWTRPDPKISAFLAENGRYGIPFNAVYSPKFPRGKVLPELLTRESVEGAIINK